MGNLFVTILLSARTGALGNGKTSEPFSQGASDPAVSNEGDGDSKVAPAHGNAPESEPLIHADANCTINTIPNRLPNWHFLARKSLLRFAKLRAAEPLERFGCLDCIAAAFSLRNSL
jgi:hypothetical protein